MVKLTVSVIIVTRNRADLLGKCLLSLSKQTIQPQEVIIVDNASTDNTKQVIDSFKKKLRLNYLYESSIGIPVARNRGLKLAEGDLILMTDDDCVAKADWVEMNIKSHLDNPEPTAIKGHSVSIPKDSPYVLIMQNYRDYRLKKCLSPQGDVLYLGTDNASFKRIKLLKLGVKFDESMKRASDLDFAARIIENGGKIIFDKKIIVYCRERSNLWQFAIQRYQGGVSQSTLMNRWPGLTYYYYHTSPLEHIKSYLKTNKYLYNKRAYLKIIYLPFILFLAIICFEFGRLVCLINRKKSYLRS